MTSHWRDPRWTYHAAASHANGDSFRRRQRERIRAAEQARKATEQETVRKVRTINNGRKSA